MQRPLQNIYLYSFYQSSCVMTIDSAHSPEHYWNTSPKHFRNMHFISFYTSFRERNSLSLTANKIYRAAAHGPINVRSAVFRIFSWWYNHDLHLFVSLYAFHRTMASPILRICAQVCMVLFCFFTPCDHNHRLFSLRFYLRRFCNLSVCHCVCFKDSREAQHTPWHALIP